MVIVTNSNRGLPKDARDILSPYFAKSHAQPEDFTVFPTFINQTPRDHVETLLGEKLCSTGVFSQSMSALRVISQDSPKEVVVHRRVIVQSLPLSELKRAECKGLHPDIISALVLGIDFNRSGPGYPLSKSANVQNHVLCPKHKDDEKDFGVCVLTSVRCTKLGFTSPINYRQDSPLPPGSVLLFTT